MDLFEAIELQDCPICGGAGLWEAESSRIHLACVDCGSHSVNIDYKEASGRKEAAERAAGLWNTGKVISSHPGE